MLIQSLLTTVAVLMAGQVDRATVSPSEATIERCELHSIEDLPVPGSDAGVLLSLKVKDGEIVKKGEELATIDDREAKAVSVAKQLDYEVAQQKADSDVDVLYAQATADVSKSAYEKIYAANKGLAGAVTQIEIMRAKYEWEKAKLGVEKNKEESLSNKATAKAKKAEADAARVVYERRTLKAPFDGVVVDIIVKEGGWVAPGDPVVQIVRVDRLRVHGELDASKWSRADIDGRTVTVEVTLPKGRVVKIPGKIVFVSPIIGVGSKLPVRAEIDTPMEDGVPLVAAGMDARMTIHVNEPGTREARPASTRGAARATRN
jgi:multidrug efflux pump subunit AcrA (membrane-fusion protein)